MPPNAPGLQESGEGMDGCCCGSDRESCATEGVNESEVGGYFCEGLVKG